MTELGYIFDQLERQGWVCVLKWDGERSSKPKTVVVSKSAIGKLFRGDFHDFDEALTKLVKWLESEGVSITKE